MVKHGSLLGGLILLPAIGALTASRATAFFARVESGVLVQLALMWSSLGHGSLSSVASTSDVCQ